MLSEMLILCVQFPEFPSPVLTRMWWSWSRCELRGCPCRSHFLSRSWWRLRWWLSGSLAQETEGIRWTVINKLSEDSIKTKQLSHIIIIPLSGKKLKQSPYGLGLGYGGWSVQVWTGSWRGASSTPEHCWGALKHGIETLTALSAWQCGSLITLTFLRNN